jgi:hypothetical protein
MQPQGEWPATVATHDRERAPAGIVYRSRLRPAPGRARSTATPRARADSSTSRRASSACQFPARAAGLHREGAARPNALGAWFDRCRCGAFTFRADSSASGERRRVVSRCHPLGTTRAAHAAHVLTQSQQPFHAIGGLHESVTNNNETRRDAGFGPARRLLMSFVATT